MFLVGAAANLIIIDKKCWKKH